MLEMGKKRVKFTLRKSVIIVAIRRQGVSVRVPQGPGYGQRNFIAKIIEIFEGDGITAQCKRSGTHLLSLLREHGSLAGLTTKNGFK